MEVKKQGTKKILSVLNIICCVSVLILAGMQIFDIWKNAIYIVQPLLGIFMLLQAIKTWKNSKLSGIIFLALAILILWIVINAFSYRFA